MAKWLFIVVSTVWTLVTAVWLLINHTELGDELGYWESPTQWFEGTLEPSSEGMYGTAVELVLPSIDTMSSLFAQA